MSRRVARYPRPSTELHRPFLFRVDPGGPRASAGRGAAPAAVIRHPLGAVTVIARTSAGEAPLAAAPRRVTSAAPRRVTSPAPCRVTSAVISAAPRRVTSAAPRRVTSAAPRRVTSPVTSAAPRRVTPAAPRRVTSAAPRRVTSPAPRRVTSAAPRGFTCVRAGQRRQSGRAMPRDRPCGGD